MTSIPLRVLGLAIVAAGLACAEVPAGEGEGDEGEGEGEGTEGEGEGEGEGEASTFAGLVLNEITCAGDNGVGDYVELTNTSATELSFDGVILTDDPNNLAQRMTLRGTLAAGAFTSISPTFGVSCTDTLSLLRPDGVVVDVVTLPGSDELTEGAGHGRLPDGSGAFTTTSATPGAANQAFVDASDVLFQPLQNPFRIDLTISAAGEAALRDGATEFAYVDGTFKLSGNGLDDPVLTVGLRKKGKVGSRRGFDQKMAWKIDFDRVLPDQKYRRISKLNLNNMVQDPSTVHEYMAYRMIEDAGLPTPRLGAATVFVNGVEFGTYLMIEAFDDDLYLKRGFPVGLLSLFEGGLTEAACCDFTDLLPEEITRFEHDGGDEVIGRAALVELSNRLNGAAPEDVFTALDPILDWEQALTTMATEAVIGHWDGYQVSPNNFYLHLGVDQKWRLIASGVDQTFGHEGRVDVVFNGNGRLYQRCRENATCSALYHDKLTEAVARADALLAGSFEDDVDAVVQLHMTTFSSARLESSLDNIPFLKGDAFAYLNERLVILKQALACDGLGDRDDCTVDVGNGPEPLRCGDFEGGRGCVD
ncbi:MAG: CotH kinase family protein [Deltaproteobacteria bacterium]|nr:CotH kinase family protein [Deltaproteobacteria bacterium]